MLSMELHNEIGNSQEVISVNFGNTTCRPALRVTSFQTLDENEHSKKRCSWESGTTLHNAHRSRFKSVESPTSHCFSLSWVFNFRHISNQTWNAWQGIAAVNHTMRVHGTSCPLGLIVSHTCHTWKSSSRPSLVFHRTWSSLFSIKIGGIIWFTTRNLAFQVLGQDQVPFSNTSETHSERLKPSLVMVCRVKWFRIGLCSHHISNHREVVLPFPIRCQMYGHTFYHFLFIFITWYYTNK